MFKKKILIVEDEAIIAHTLKFVLENLGYEVPAIIENGEAVLDAYLFYNPDLVLMDIQLKGDVDGIVAASIIKKQTNASPVIFLTAYSDDITTNRARITEPYGYILKPFDERALNISIEMALYKHDMERRLFESDQRFHTVLRSIGNPVITTDASGRITFANFVAEEYLGLPQSEMINTPWSDNFCFNTTAKEHNNNPHTTNLLELAMLQGISERLPEDAVIKVKKNNTWLSAAGSVISPIIDDTGQLLGSVIILHSEHKQFVKN